MFPERELNGIERLAPSSRGAGAGVPQIPVLAHVVVGEQRFALANRIHPRVEPEGMPSGQVRGHASPRHAPWSGFVFVQFGHLDRLLGLGNDLVGVLLHLANEILGVAAIAVEVEFESAA
jgi:hypothetical protein